MTADSSASRKTAASEPPVASAAAPAAGAEEAVECMAIEKCFEELERIVAGLESQNVSLEESLRLFERGMKLSARCSRELTQVERRIQIIMENAKSGAVQAKDFAAEDLEEQG